MGGRGGVGLGSSAAGAATPPPPSPPPKPTCAPPCRLPAAAAAAAAASRRIPDPVADSSPPFCLLLFTSRCRRRPAREAECGGGRELRAAPSPQLARPPIAMAPPLATYPLSPPPLLRILTAARRVRSHGASTALAPPTSSPPQESPATNQPEFSLDRNLALPTTNRNRRRLIPPLALSSVGWSET